MVHQPPKKVKRGTIVKSKGLKSIKGNSMKEKELLAQAKKGNREMELLHSARLMFKALNKAVWVPDDVAALIVAERGRPSGFGLAYGKLAEALEAYGPKTPEALGAAVFRTIK